MNLTSPLKVSLAAACVIAFAGCTDLKPIQAQIDDLKSQVSKLQGDTSRAASEAAAAHAAANSAQSAASGAQSTANQALSTAQSNSTAIEAINEKIDRMFKKSVSKEFRAVDANVRRRGQSAGFCFARGALGLRRARAVVSVTNECGAPSKPSAACLEEEEFSAL